MSTIQPEAGANTKGIPPSPYAVGQRTLEEIIADLSNHVPDHHLKWKPVGRGQNTEQIPYIPWHTTKLYLDYFAPGWKFRIDRVYQLQERVCVAGTLTIYANVNGTVWEFERSATGQEENAVSGYGDPVSNAEGMCFRRCGAKFGLGLYLYFEKPQQSSQQRSQSQTQAQAPQRAQSQSQQQGGGADKRDTLPISQAQITLARRLAGEKGQDEEGLCQRKWGVSLVDCTMKQGSELIDYLKTLPDAAPPQRPVPQAPQAPTGW